LYVFGVLTGVGVDVSTFFGFGAGVLKRGAGTELESEKCDSAHLWSRCRSQAKVSRDLISVMMLVVKQNVIY